MSAALTIDDQKIERDLARVAESFRFILDVTPVNVEEQRTEFLRGRVPEPQFAYRELEDHPQVIGASLDAIDLDAVEDTVLHDLLRAKHRELELQLQMLRERGTPHFRQLSEELYGTVEPALLERAEWILAHVEGADGPDPECVDATEFAHLAELELAHYRDLEPDIGVHVEVRGDVAGVMVSGSVLLVSSATCIHKNRVHAILQHEVGTHLLTHVNGTFQPLALLASGLAGYDETQEGLAVLVEHLVGGLTAFRVRQLAARVAAVNLMSAGATFKDVFDSLTAAGFSRQTAFTTTMRVFRAGGFTKDAIYLRGFLHLLKHLREGGALEGLWVGKLSLRELPLIENLVERGVLESPRLLPHFFTDDIVLKRIREAADAADSSLLAGGLT